MKLEDRRVELSDRSYAIAYGALDQLGPRLAKLRSPTRCAVVTNPIVGALYAESCLASLREAGFEPFLLEIPDGEHHKTLDTWSSLVESLVGKGVDRKTPVVALGGGVTGDVAGFAAASTLRGLPVVQVPTTLLAMVDSSVGGKTGVNLSAGKNLVGAFYQPELVYVDVNCLETLPDEEIRSGLGEVVKHAMIDGDPFFARLEGLVPALTDRDPAAFQEVVDACCRIKAAVVSEDERETGRRAVLNLGHSIGHAVETVLGFGVIRHGEAVAMGLLAEAAWAHAHGICELSAVNRLRSLMASLGLKTQVSCEKNDLIAALYRDKKMSRAKLLLPVPVGVGEVRLDLVDPSELRLAAEMVSGEG